MNADQKAALIDNNDDLFNSLMTDAFDMLDATDLDEDDLERFGVAVGMAYESGFKSRHRAGHLWEAWVLDEVIVGTFRVVSSNVMRIGWHTRQFGKPGTLFIEFSGNAWYRYENVPAEVAYEAVVAESVGRFIDQNVKKAGFAYSRVEYAQPRFLWNPLLEVDEGYVNRVADNGEEE